MIVLKIILMILGILLGVLLLLILALLFVPIRYKVSGEVREEKNFKANITWFLSVFGVHFQYDPDQTIRVWLRIFFWKKMLYASEDDPENNETDELTQVDRSGQENELSQVDKAAQENELSQVDKVAQESEPPQVDVERSKMVETPQKDESVKSGASIQEEEQEPKKNRKEKPGDNIRRMIDRIKTFHYDDRDKTAISHIKEELIKLLKHLCPVKSRLELKYSTGSPDTTGISLGVIAMFPLAYKSHWDIVPDFEAEEAYARGQGWMKGRIYVYYLLLILLRLYRDKNCYRLYRKIKRFK